MSLLNLLVTTHPPFEPDVRGLGVRTPALRLTGVGLAALVALLCACERDQPDRGEAPIHRIEVPTHAATTPAPHTGWREKRFEKIMRRVAQGEVDVAFLGDSLTHKWNKEGKPVWERYYEHRSDPSSRNFLDVANFGVGGDRTQHVLWRIENGNFAHLSPRLIVLEIGSNNLRQDSPRETADGVIAILQQLKIRLPDAQILLLALFPRGASPDDSARAKIRETNRILAGLDDADGIHFLDIGQKFLAADGTIPPEVMHDSVHLTERGYEIWARAMEPRLTELINRE
jgi:beta-glucosidase